MPTKFVNISLLALLTVLTATGLLALVFSAGADWLFALHRLAGVALVLLLPWKALIAWRSLRRRWSRAAGRAFAVGVSLPLAGLTVLTLALVLAWTLNWTALWGVFGYPALLLHWYTALLLLPFLGFHVFYHWYPRPAQGLLNTRRQFLRASVLGVGAVFAWTGLTVLANALQALDALRRFSGSRHVGSFTGNAMPVTMLLTDNPAPLDLAAWRLTVTGFGVAELSLGQADLAALPASDLTATLDCTNGWYSAQHWRGVRLGDVLARAGLSATAAAVVRVVSVTGHSVVLPLAQAREALLATAITGESLTHPHGAPLRLVHPALRGWLWIKWVTRVEVVSSQSSVASRQSSAVNRQSSIINRQSSIISL